MKRLTLILLLLTVSLHAQDFKKDWENIMRLESVGEFKKAAAATDVVFANAKKTRNEPQLLKAFFFRSKYLQMLEPNAQQLILSSLQAEIKTASAPTAALMQSLYAGMLYEVYHKNMYQYNARTTVNVPTLQNIAEWSGQNFRTAIEEAYKASIANRDVLYKTPLRKYADVIDFAPGIVQTNRSLYDFLLTCYTDYLAENDGYGTFIRSVKDAEFFLGNEKAFQQRSLADSLSAEMAPYRLFQQSEAFYAQKNDAYSLQRAVLRRIEHAEKDINHRNDLKKIELATVGQLYTTWGNNSPFAWRALLKQASLYQNIAHKKHAPDYMEKALKLCGLLIENKDKHDVLYQAELLKAGIINSTVSLRTEKYVANDKPILASVNFKDVNSINVAVYRVPYPVTERYSYSYSRYYASQQKTDSLLKTLKPVVQQTYTLPKVQKYYSFSTEVILPALPKGYYIIATTKTGGNPDDVAYTEIQSTALSILQDGAQENEYTITHRNTGAPVVGAMAKDSTSIGYTDSSGRIKAGYNYQVSRNQDRIITISYQGDTLIKKYYAYAKSKNTRYSSEKNKHNESPYEDAEVKVNVYFDRPIYRPGQQVFFKGIVTMKNNGQYGVVPNVFFTVIAKDRSKNEIASFRVKTNEFGSFTGEFDLPKNMLTGQFQLWVEEDETPEEDPAYNKKDEMHPFWDYADFSQAYFGFKVEEYKRPTFYVALKPVTKAFAVNDSITVAGSAKAFSGAPLTGATVKYTVKRNVYSHIYRDDNGEYDTEHDYDYDYYDYYPSAEPEGKFIASGTVQTDAKGNYSLTFKALPQKKDPDAKKTYSYSIHIDVTDINGELHSTDGYIKAGSVLLEANLILPKTIIAEDGATLNFSATNLNGHPQEAEGEITIYKKLEDGRTMVPRPWRAPEVQTISKEDFIKAFPHLPYDSKGDTLYAAQPVFTQKVNTGTQKDIILNDFKNWDTGNYKVVFTVKDSLGRTEKIVQNTTFTRKADKKVAPGEIFTLAATNKNPVKDGYVAVEIRTALPVVYGALAAKVDYEKVYDKDLIIKDGYAVVKIPTVKNPETFMAITLDIVWQNNYYTKTIDVAIHEKVVPLTIETESITNKLTPGSEQTWTFTLKNGKNREAELLAGMYDASLDQLSRDYWRKPETYIYNTTYSSYRRIITEGISFGDFDDFVQPKGQVKKWSDNIYTYGFNILADYNRYIQYMPKTNIKEKGDITVSGVVTDREGLPAPGVTVRVHGTHEGVYTDLEGLYTLYAAKNETIDFEYVGEIITRKIPDNGILNVVFKNSSELAEVVITTYKTISRPLSTDAVTTVSSFAIQDDVKGLNISYGSGQPGANSTIILRGYGSGNGDIQPLYVIDGVPLSADDFKALNPDNIADVSILKDASATALYGNRGANGVVVISTKKAAEKAAEELAVVKTRKNFAETAFFYPQLKTNRKGNISFSFTTPEALTRWKLRLLAHNKKAVSGYAESLFITQKDLMVVPNMPRFLRETDTITIQVKISNLTVEPKSGNAMLQLFDAATMQPLDAQMANSNAIRPFELLPGGNTVVRWKIVVPVGVQGVQYKVVAKAGNYTDGEENILPVLPNSMLVTESLPLWVRENTTQTYTLQNLKNNTSSTLRHQGITLEYTSNPAWLALQSLPYLMEFEHECAEQLFSRYYANSIATHIIDSNPKIAELFAKWREKGITSKLQQNEELKSVINAETPWMLDNQSEEEQHARLALMFNLNDMRQNVEAVFKKLKDRQMPSGGFAWFSGGSEDEYITRHIVAGFGHLLKMNALVEDGEDTDIDMEEITDKAIPYIDGKFTAQYKRDYVNRKKNAKFTLINPYNQLHYLYARSSFLKDYPMDDSLKAATRAYLAKIKQDWTDYTLYQKGLAALVMHRYGEAATAKKVMTYLKESSANNTEVGMHWLDNKPGWWWYQAPVETQALLIEAFTEVAQDTASVNAMKVWLIKQKQNKNWPTTKATTEAVYALLLQGTDWLSVQGTTTFTLGKKEVLESKLAAAEPEAGTGYVKLQWQPQEVSNDMATLTVQNNSKVPGYGGFYWQYFEDLDKIKPSQEGIMSVKKELYRKNTGQTTTLEPITESSPIKVGDKVTIRLVITLTEDAEFVHLKDMRAAGLEPVEVISGYQYQDGLSYYKSTRDVATNFFFSSINRGTYVLEYDVKVNNAGAFSNGITTIQSMYAPEFSGHTKGTRITAQPQD